MKLTLLGSGGFRVPLMFRTLLVDQSDRRVTDLRLWDTDAGRLAVIRSILQAMAQGHPRAPDVQAAQSLEEAVAGTDSVFGAIRAALEGSLDLAVAAFAHHPLIDGVGVARELLERARAEFPKLGYLS